MYKKTSILYASIIFLSAVSCSKDSNKNELKELALNEKITTQKWCYAESLSSNINVITRLKFLGDGKNSFSKENLTTRERIIFSDKLQTSIYEYSNKIGWEMFKKESFLFGDRYAIELSEEDATDYNSDIKLQKNIIANISKLNSSLVNLADQFAPKKMIKIRYSPSLSTKEESIFAYPCDSYSDFVANIEQPRRPMVELNLYLNQEVWSASHPYSTPDEDAFEKKMLLKFPVDLNYEIDTEKLNGTSWCSWRQVAGTMANVVTFGKNKYIKNSYFDNGQESLDFLIKLWESKVVDSTIYLLDLVEEGIIKSSGKSKYISSDLLNSVFISVKDSNGTDILVEANPYSPENSIFIFPSYYFPCTDKRPLEIDSFFNKHLEKIIEVQKKYIENI